MDLEIERLLKLIFPNGLPENLRDNQAELSAYLAKLGTCKINVVKKETTRLVDETKRKLEQTENLAISNYKTFIETAEKSRSVSKQFQKAESQLEALIKRFPKFNEMAEMLKRRAEDLNEQRRLNSTTLKKNAQLLEILELPQLMARCIRENRYEEALELAACAQKMGQHHEDIPIIKSISGAVEALWHMMLTQLVAQLRTDLQLPKCLQIVGYLRRMQAFSDAELKIKFLQARNAWFTAALMAIPQNDAQQHLTKTIEITRINLFNIITQYRAIFPEDEKSANNILPHKSLEVITCNGNRLFQAWLHNKIDDFLTTLEQDLSRGVNSLDTLLGQCMYFGLSFSRVGADFRALIAPIFMRVIREKFQSKITQVNKVFESELEKYTLINKVVTHARKDLDTSVTAAASTEQHSPPETLLDFHPLALLCNGFLNALNELRICAPIALANDVTNCMQDSLELAARQIYAFYRQEQQAFSGTERVSFMTLCACFAYDLLPYLQHCIHSVFPKQHMCTHLGVSPLILEERHITYFRREKILSVIKNMLPV